MPNQRQIPGGYFLNETDTGNRQAPSGQFIIGVSTILIIRLTGDVLTTGWVPSTGILYYDVLDETSFNDSDYVISPTLSSATPLILDITSLPIGSYIINIRAYKTDTVGQLRLSLLDSSNASQGVSSWQSLTNSYVSYAISITTTGISTRLKIEVST